MNSSIHEIQKANTCMAQSDYSGPNESSTSCFNGCPVSYTLSVIGGKWKMSILYILSMNPNIRFNELQRQLQKITFKTLSVQLKELAADGLVLRNEYPQIPPKVEYCLTEKGKTIIPILDAMCNWGKQNQPK